MSAAAAEPRREARSPLLARGADARGRRVADRRPAGRRLTDVPGRPRLPRRRRRLRHRAQARRCSACRPACSPPPAPARPRGRLAAMAAGVRGVGRSRTGRWPPPASPGPTAQDGRAGRHGLSAARSGRRRGPERRAVARRDRAAADHGTRSRPGVSGGAVGAVWDPACGERNPHSGSVSVRPPAVSTTTGRVTWRCFVGCWATSSASVASSRG